VKRLRVFISAAVYGQIEEIVNYIALDSVDNAVAWQERLLFALNALSEKHGHAIDEAASKRIGHRIRKTVFERTYLIHYLVGPAQVDVVNIRHGARLPREGEP
jgi:plasmid stabilization system protein ParE